MSPAETLAASLFSGMAVCAFAFGIYLLWTSR